MSMWSLIPGISYTYVTCGCQNWKAFFLSFSPRSLTCGSCTELYACVIYSALHLGVTRYNYGPTLYGSRNNAVGIVTNYRLGNTVVLVRFPEGVRIYF